MNSVKEPSQETQLDNPIRSPFQLNKTKGPVRLVPLHAAIRDSSHGNTSTTTTTTTTTTTMGFSLTATSPTSSTSSIGTSCSDTMSPRSVLGENPFSFSVHKIGALSLSPRSSVGSGHFDLDGHREIQRLKKEIEVRNKDIETKDAKLSSSVKSIKQFWSPELKKERAVRKEEEGKTKNLEEKLKGKNEILQECQASLQQLETELNLKKEEIKSLSTHNEDQNSELNDLRNEIRNLQTECQGIARLNQRLTELDDTNRQLIKENNEKCETICDLEKVVSDRNEWKEDYAGLESKLQLECQSHNETRKYIEKFKDESLKLRQDVSAEQYVKKLAELEKELSTVKETLVQKEKLNQDTKKDADRLQEQFKNQNKELNNLKDEFLTKKDECNTLNEELSTATQTLVKHKKLYQDTKDDRDRLQEQIKNQNEELNNLEDELRVKEEEWNRLHGELSTIKETLVQQENFNQDDSNSLQDQVKNQNEELNNLKCEFHVKEEECNRLRKEVKKINNLTGEFHVKEEECNRLREEVKKINNLTGEFHVKEEECNRLREEVKKINNLKCEFHGKEEECNRLREEVKKINNLTDEFHVKEEECNRLHKEVGEIKKKLATLSKENVTLKESEEKLKIDHQCALEEKSRLSDVKSSQLDERFLQQERQIGDLENQLQQNKAAAMSSLILSEDLKLKTKEVQELSLKYNNLNKYLSERELALDNSREEVAELKEKNQTYMTSNKKLKGQTDEQKVLLDRLQKEKVQLEKSKLETVNLHAYDKLKVQLEANKVEMEKQKELLDDKENTLKNLQKDVQEKEKVIKELERKHFESSSGEKVTNTDIEKMEKENEELSKEINFLKIKVGTLEKQRTGSFGSEEKPLTAKKNLWDELSRKDARIEELEKLLKEKARLLNATKKTKTTEWEKQQMKTAESKKSEEDIDAQIAKFKADNEQKANRISLLEEALREMVAVAKERENIMARYAEVYEEVESKYEEADREYARICFERSITNIKNALLILILCEREALISSMKLSYKSYLDELFAVRQERLMTCISEMDTQIARLESQSSKAKREEIGKMRQEKEKVVTQLKEHNRKCMSLNSNEDKVHAITHELKEAPSEHVYEAIRHLTHTNTLLESKVEEFLAFLHEKNAELLKDVGNVPVRKGVPDIEVMKNFSKDALIKELMAIEEHSATLQKFVEDLLTLLEGDQ